MATQIQFKPLCQTKNENALCYVLIIDECKILLDCGWTEQFNLKDLNELLTFLQQEETAEDKNPIDAILLTHADIPHIGALPLICKFLDPQIPIFATVPVHHLGQMALYDAHEAISQRFPFRHFTLDDVDIAFERITQIHFLQPCSFQGLNSRGIEVTAFPAGHSLGGSFWKIKKEEEEIIYSVDFNLSKDRHLNGTVLEAMKRPSLLIADSQCAATLLPNRKQRDKEMFDSILKALRSGGNVLMPCDTSTRSLELALCLDQQWELQKIEFGLYGLAFLTSCSYDTIEFTKSLLEWMIDIISKKFDETHKNPFDFKHVKLVNSIEELNALPKPICVLASGNALSPSFSFDLFAQWSQIHSSLVLFTDKSTEDSLSRKLIDSLPNPPKSINIEIGHSTLIEIIEEEEEEEKQKQQQKNQEEQKEHQMQISKEEKKNKEKEKEKETSTTTTTEKINPLVRSCDATNEQFRRNGFAFPIFPFEQKPRQFDVYGEVINPENYVSLEEKMKIEQQQTKLGEGNSMQMVSAAAPVVKEKPKKRVYSKEQKSIEIVCQMKYINMEGRSDSKSLHTIISHVSPRRLVLIHAKHEHQLNLSRWCEENIKQLKSVICPNENELIDVTSEVRVFRALLHDSLIPSFQTTKDNYEVAFINSEVAEKPSAESGIPILLPISSANNLLDPRKRWHESVHIGDVKMNEFLELLKKNGFQANLQQGTLRVNGGRIVIKKTESTDDFNSSALITIETSLSEEYFKVRDLLQSQVVSI